MSCAVFNTQDRWSDAALRSLGYSVIPQDLVKGYKLNLLNFVGYFPVLSTVGGTVRVVYAIVNDGVTHYTAIQMVRGAIELSGCGSVLVLPDIVTTGWRVYSHCSQHISQKMMKETA